MSSLYLLRGAPASGKSEFIADNGLESNTVTVSKVRNEMYPPDEGEEGRHWISPSANKNVWLEVYDRLEKIMESGKTAILDASNLRTVDMEKLRPLADDYEYLVKVVDFSDVTLEECLRRNSERSESEKIPYRMISNYFSMYDYNPVPDGYVDATKDDLLREVRNEK